MQHLERYCLRGDGDADQLRYTLDEQQDHEHDRAHSFVDWCEWKTEQTMEDVDAQIEALHMLWDREDDDWRDVIIEEDEETGAIFGYT